MLTAKELKSVLKEYNIWPSKRLGQSFLIDEHIKQKILEATQLNSEESVLEIGPGTGALTGDLCKHVKKVIAIEKDKRLYDYLSKKVYFPNLELIKGDILKYKFKTDPKVKVIGNLPYYISSDILIHFIENRSHIKSIYISLQKEFAERVVAKVVDESYGSISCYAQFYSKPEILFKIRKNSFYPAPLVDSCFLKIAILNEKLFLTDEEKLFKIIRASFGKRRKTILNSLNASDIFSSKKEAQEVLEKAGISHTRRPETISLEEFVRLTDVLRR